MKHMGPPCSNCLATARRQNKLSHGACSRCNPVAPYLQPCSSAAFGRRFSGRAIMQLSRTPACTRAVRAQKATLHVPRLAAAAHAAHGRQHARVRCGNRANITPTCFPPSRTQSPNPGRLRCYAGSMPTTMLRMARLCRCLPRRYGVGGRAWCGCLLYPVPPCTL